MDAYLRELKRQANSGDSAAVARYIAALERAVGGGDPMPSVRLNKLYPNELVLRVENGNELRCPGYPDDCDYVRVTNEEGWQYRSCYWTSDEWAQDPEGVMGAIIGALNSIDDDFEEEDEDDDAQV